MHRRSMQTCSSQIASRRRRAAALQAVSALAFDDIGAILVSGGGDTLVNAWLLAEVLDVSGSGGAPGAPVQLAGAAPLRPLHSWSDHTLPVTALAVGAGGAGAIVVSASLDRSVKVRALAQGGLLLSAAFPASIHRCGAWSRLAGWLAAAVSRLGRAEIPRFSSCILVLLGGLVGGWVVRVQGYLDF
jgi:hypothetical protein